MIHLTGQLRPNGARNPLSHLLLGETVKEFKADIRINVHVYVYVWMGE